MYIPSGCTENTVPSICGGKRIPVLSEKCPTNLEPYMKNLPKMTRC